MDIMIGKYGCGMGIFEKCFCDMYLCIGFRIRGGGVRGRNVRRVIESPLARFLPYIYFSNLSFI